VDCVDNSCEIGWSETSRSHRRLKAGPSQNFDRSARTNDARSAIALLDGESLVIAILFPRSLAALLIRNVRLCNDVFDDYLAPCEARFKRHDLAAATVRSYQKILDDIWRPRIGRFVLDQVRYSHLLRIADNRTWSKKTYNNVISVLKRTFDFG